MGDLYWGDNLRILRDRITSESVDLIYLDPPFNSNRNYNVLFRENGKAESDAQIEAFTDTWHWGSQAALAYDELVYANHIPQKVSQLIEAMRSFIGENDVMAYLVMMTLRLLELHRVLKPTGSIYLHCDPTASHYLKVVMDTIWGPRNFRNEIIWKRTTSHSDAKRWSPVHDTILYYGKSEDVVWNPQYVPHTDDYVASKYRHSGPDGRRFQLDNMTSPNPRPNMMYEWKGFASPPNGWRFSRETMARLDTENRIWYPEDKRKRPRIKRYLDEMLGMLVGSVWTDVDPINSQAAERLGYPTQKPEALLERIVLASSNPGDVVLDPFCGCGTAVAVAERLGRRWIGIDITHLAITAVVYRLESAFPGIKVILDGNPKDIGGAELLAETDRYGFQQWALSLVIAKPAATDSAGKVKKGADKGIDGYISFVTGRPRTAGSCIVQVKSGHVNVGTIRDLRGTVERDSAEAGLLVTLEEPTGPMTVEALGAGYFESDVTQARHPRIQIVTIRELLAGTKPDLPPRYNPFQLSTARQRGIVTQTDLFGQSRASGG